MKAAGTASERSRVCFGKSLVGPVVDDLDLFFRNAEVANQLIGLGG